MKKFRILITLLSTVLLFTACEKNDEISTSNDSISGVLTAGENVIAEDFNTIQIIIGKLYDEVVTSSRVFGSEDVDFTRQTDLKADGSFTFENLDIGNYLVKPSEGFIFAIDTFALVTIDGKTVKQLNRTIERGNDENAW